MLIKTTMLKIITKNNKFEKENENFEIVFNYTENDPKDFIIFKMKYWWC